MKAGMALVFVVIGYTVHVKFLAQYIDHDFALVSLSINLDDTTDVECSLSGKTIWSQLPTGRELEDVVTTTGKIKSVSSSTLTSRTADSSNVLENDGYFSGDVIFSDNTKLTFRKGICVGGLSTEGEF